MPIYKVFSICLVLLFLIQSLACAEDTVIPGPVGEIYVQDFAEVLDDQEEMELINLGRRIEDQTTAQLAVLTIDSIGDQSIEEFSNEVFRQYGIGNKEEDNGVLLIVGMNPSPGMSERPLRIEVGYGLEGRLPDGKVGRILDEITIPYLKNGQTDTAILETYKVLANEVLAEYGIEEGYQSIQEPVPETQTNPNEGIGIPSWLLLIIVVMVLFLDFKFFGGFLTHMLLSILSRGGRGGGRGGGGGSSGGGGASRGW